MFVVVSQERQRPRAESGRRAKVGYYSGIIKRLSLRDALKERGQEVLVEEKMVAEVG